MDSDVDLEAIRIAILDRLRGQPCWERISNVEVRLADNNWGWTACAVGELTNDDMREFIATKFAVQRTREFPSD